MALADNIHSRLVAWLKILLPLAALAILSTLFMVAESFDPEAAIPYAERDALDEIVQEQRIGAPSFSGVAEDGTAVVASAESARPDPANPERVVGQTLAARFDLPGAGSVTVRSPSGSLDGTSQQIRLEGGAEITSTTGYVVQTDGVTGRLDGTFVRTDGTVTAHGPAGRLKAGQMVLERGEGQGYLLRFTDGVTLIYDPQP